MKTYKLKQRMLITLLDPQSSNDYIFYPSDNIQIVVDNNTVFLKDLSNECRLYESSNTVEVIEKYVEDKILEEIE